VAASRLGFPLLVKPNIGGRGAGIMRFDSRQQLRSSIDQGKLELGIDQVALVQEFIPPRGGHITRVETLGGKFLYAIDVFTSGEDFNLCPAEICRNDPDAPKPGLKVQASTPRRDVIDAVEKIVAHAGIDAGSVEYLTDDRDGRAVFYDINALSNFVAEAPRVIGFDPHGRLVDYLERQREGQ
jgi:glutathione synthase/RimK-type ligase-like ATP-grasp enzyme